MLVRNVIDKNKLLIIFLPFFTQVVLVITVEWEERVAMYKMPMSTSTIWPSFANCRSFSKCVAAAAQNVFMFAFEKNRLKVLVLAVKQPFTFLLSVTAPPAAVPLGSQPSRWPTARTSGCCST